MPLKKSHQRFAIASTQVVTPTGLRSAVITIANGLIESIVAMEDFPSDVSCDYLGDVIISPGVIDSHVHINEPGRTDWEGFETATSAAAAGGITTMIDMPLNSSPVTTNIAALNAKRSAASGKCRVDVGFYGGVVPGNSGNIQELIEGGVFGIKSFLCDSGLDEFPATALAELRSVLPVLKSAGIPLLVHAELTDPTGAAVQGGQPAPTDERSYQQYLTSRPDRWELAAIKALIDLCRECSTPIHVVHVATAEAVDLIIMAKSDGLPMTFETCPHYLFFDAEQIPDGDTRFKCAPPIRSAENRQRLWLMLTSGAIDTIGTDHSPCPPELKSLDKGSFSEAWGGIAGLQFSLSVMATLARQNGISPESLAQWMSVAPAKLIGLENRKGRLEPGFDADLVVWEPDKSFVVDPKNIYHRHRVTPYEGAELFGVVQRTYVRGQLVFQNGNLVGEPQGKLLRRPSRLVNSTERPTEKLGRPSSGSLADHLNRLPDTEFISAMLQCCASSAWAGQMVSARPFASDAVVEETTSRIWRGLSPEDWLEAFLAHPRIGDVETLREKFANTKQWAEGEQAGTSTSSEATLSRLARLNDDYAKKFGFLFIVCATGKSADEMLQILEGRLPNDPEMELKIAAEEQLKITLIRLRKI